MKEKAVVPRLSTQLVTAVDTAAVLCTAVAAAAVPNIDEPSISNTLHALMYVSYHSSTDI